MSESNLPAVQNALVPFNPEDCELVTQDESSVQQSILDRLRELGVTSVKVRYSGSSDESSVYQMEVSPAEIDLTQHSSGNTINVYNGDGGDDFESVDISLEEALDTFTMDLVDRFYPGFEDNEGGAGSLSIDVATGQMVLKHGVSYQADEHEPTQIEPLADALNSHRFSFTEDRAIKPETVEALMAHAERCGVANIRVEYSGSGDSGNQPELTATDADGQEVDVFAIFDAPDLVQYVRYSGSMEEATEEAAKRGLLVLERNNQAWIGKPRGTRSLGECLEVFFDYLADIKNPGYEINEGGGGSFSLDLKSNQLVVDIYATQENTDEVEHKFGAPGVAVIENQKPRLSHSMG